MANPSKINFVNKHLSNLSTSPFFVILGFGKSNHQQLEILRKQINQLNKENQVLLKVVKNSLFKVSLEKFNHQNNTFSDDQLKQLSNTLINQTAVCYIKKDYQSILSIINSVAKDNENIIFKIGYLDKTIYDSQKLQQIAQLPGYEVLIGQLTARLKAPQSKFVYVTKYNINKLVYILKQMRAN